MPVSGPMAGSGRWRVAVAVGLGMHQESGAAIQFGANEIQAALGLLPGLHHHVLQLFVQELFGGFFELRIHFHVIRQHAELSFTSSSRLARQRCFMRSA